ncbi:MAG: SsrA-binding protein SmpB [bacterium]
MAAAKDKKEADKTATNRKAFHDYIVVDRIEAGIELLGTEVKSVRAGNVALTGGYAMIETSGRMMLHDVHIAPYECGNQFNHEPTRLRTLLLHRKEIDRLKGKIAQHGYTLIPLKMYFRKRWAKVEIGLCKGKQDEDKRDSLRRKDADKEARRAMARNR